MTVNTSGKPTEFRPITLILKRGLARIVGKAAAIILPLGLLLCGVQAHAGEESSLDLKQVAPQAPPPSLEEPWVFTLGVPGWMPGVYGTVGINGFNSEANVGFQKIFPRIDFVTSVEAGVQKGKFGMDGSLLYLSLGADASRGGLLSKVDLRLDEYLADIGFSYRIVEGPHGWLDALAGCRYTNLYQRITLHPDDGAINDASTDLVDGVSQRIAQKLSDSNIAGTIQSLVTQRVVDRLQDLTGNYPNLPIGPVDGSRLGIIKDVIVRIVDKFKPDLLAAVKAEAQAKTATLKATAQQRVNYLKTKLADAISSKLTSLLNQSASKTNYWFDPYVGLRGRLNLNKAFYLTGRGDIGGFDVGSELTWQVYGAVGCQLTRNIYAEAGYRCLFDNYRGGGLTYDVYTRGVELNMGVTF